MNIIGMKFSFQTGTTLLTILSIRKELSMMITVFELNYIKSLNHLIFIILSCFY